MRRNPTSGKRPIRLGDAEYEYRPDRIPFSWEGSDGWLLRPGGSVQHARGLFLLSASELRPDFLESLASDPLIALYRSHYPLRGLVTLDWQQVQLSEQLWPFRETLIKWADRW